MPVNRRGVGKLRMRSSVRGVRGVRGGGGGGGLGRVPPTADAFRLLVFSSAVS